MVLVDILAFEVVFALASTGAFVLMAALLSAAWLFFEILLSTSVSYRCYSNLAILTHRRLSSVGFWLVLDSGTRSLDLIESYQ